MAKTIQTHALFRFTDDISPSDGGGMPCSGNEKRKKTIGELQ